MGAEDFDFALHVCESIAFTLHGALRLSEPCTGIFGKFIAKDSVPYPNIFFPIVGLISLVVSVVNIVCSGSDTIILAVQAYVVAWHSAAAFTHIRIGDPIFVTGVPGVFVVMAFTISGLRAGWVSACAGTVLFGGIGVVSASAVVKRPTVALHDALLPRED